MVQLKILQTTENYGAYSLVHDGFLTLYGRWPVNNVLCHMRTFYILTVLICVEVPQGYDSEEHMLCCRKKQLQM